MVWIRSLEPLINYAMITENVSCQRYEKNLMIF